MIKLNKKLNIIAIFIIILSIIININTSLSILPYRYTVDDFHHFYDMHRWYEKQIIPYTGTRLKPGDVYKDEFTIPRVPGGIYYITYTLFYKIANENLYFAKVINYIFSLSIILIFLFWFFKRFGLIMTSFMSVLVLCNGYIIRALTNFWNPNLTLIFSFIFFIFLFEYICADNELKTKLSAIFIFPVLAIMAQAHFSVFFSIVPTIIIYLIIKYKKTFKYLPYLAIGVFVSFLLYLPYLIYEIKNNFYNTYSILMEKSAINYIAFPKYQAFILFPTNEMSALFIKKLDNIIDFWFSNPPLIFGFIFLLLSLIFSAICLIGSFYIIFKSLKKKLILNNKELALKDMFLILLLSMIVSTLLFMIAPPSSGSFHYLYGIFSISYSYILLFIIKYKDIIINKKNILYTLLIFFILNSLAMSLTIKRYIDKYEKPYSIEMNKQINDYINKN
ncbi:hypothetical protein R4I97_00335 [Brachyspira pilosicoli]|uniref:hypothetical protein n=1 Tax=Brachyspira pilosicoli TaxID=52584 RepID=UPI003005EBAE